MKKSLCFVLLFTLVGLGITSSAWGEKVRKPNKKIKPPTAAWTATVEKNAPARPTVKAPVRKVLVFSHFTGYNHLVIPHTDRVIEILGKKSGAFEATITRDVEMLRPEKLAVYDVLVLNNNCSKNPGRNLFLDILKKDAKYKNLTQEQRQAEAAALEQSVLEFVRNGKGLVGIHGSPTMLNNSAEFGEMIGASFDYHPPSQPVTLTTVDPDHPLVAAFKGREPFIHTDEPYCFKGAYTKKNFVPLLKMDATKIKDSKKKRITKDIRYVAWIKPYGKGRVFYGSPSHFPESFESPTILRFYLDGIQYAAGDLKCNDKKDK
ncbi:MAG: ThuA domain-containing protein [Planctomycetia bacterium]|jgi:type 1 glutamine amidotransferase